MEEPFNRIEEIEREYIAKGMRYADWQKEQYPVTTEARSGDYKKKTVVAGPRYESGADYIFKRPQNRDSKRNVF